eukprot:m.387612 g.387612  ORF g.387612 m.387612 type:complete len:497 (+) comp20066_c6_seq2:285-1775(+)
MPNGQLSVVVPLENFISTPLDTILRELLDRLDGDKDRMRLLDIVRRLEHLYSCRINEETADLRILFQKFTSTRDVGRMSAVDKLNSSILPPMSASEVAHQEDMFLDELHRLMEQANFVMLTQSEYDDALKSDYLIDLDMRQRKERLDSVPIRRFFARNGGLKACAAAAGVCHDVLVYHRGIGVHRQEGLFVMQKVDYFIDMVFAGLFAIVSFLTAAAQVWKYPTYFKKIQLEASKDEEPGLTRTMSTDRQRTVKRVSLAASLRHSWANFFSSNSLQEPTFREMVVVYRTKQDLDATEPGQLPPIQVKSFRDIPLADFEMALPEMTPATKTLDLIKLMAALAIGIMTIIIKVSTLPVTHAQTAADKFRAILPILCGLGSYVIKIIVQFQSAHNKYAQLITQMLYSRSLDSGDGVRSYLVDQRLQQDLKEAVIAYFFLQRVRKKPGFVKVGANSRCVRHGINCQGGVSGVSSPTCFCSLFVFKFVWLFCCLFVFPLFL